MYTIYFYNEELFGLFEVAKTGYCNIFVQEVITLFSMKVCLKRSTAAFKICRSLVL